MDYYVDWNCRLMPAMKGSVQSPEDAVTAMLELSQKFHLTRFCMMPEFDPLSESVSMFLLRRDQSEKQLCDILPKELKVKYAAGIHLVPNLHQETNLKKLLFTKDGYLPIILPITDYADWIDLELNRLLYHSSYQKLLFLSCDIYEKLYPKEAMERLFRIKHAVYQFNFQALTDPFFCKRISTLLQEKKTVLLGTSLNTVGKIFHYDLACNQKSAMDLLSVADFQRMLHANRAFWDL